MDCRRGVARYRNVYGPSGTYEGGREKGPAAIRRKVIAAKQTGRHEIEIWGDGEQTRSFMYIDDYLESTQQIMQSSVHEPLNLGSDQLVTIKRLVDMVEAIAGGKLQRPTSWTPRRGPRAQQRQRPDPRTPRLGALDRARRRSREDLRLDLRPDEAGKGGVSGSGVIEADPARSADGVVRLRQRQSEPRRLGARVSYDLVAIGPWPPFIVGQSIATAALVRNLEGGGVRIRAVDTAPRNPGGKWAQRLSRVPRYVWALFALAAGRRAPWVYISVDAGIGVYVNILCAALARLRGSRVMAHHHNYSYIAQPSGRMALFCRAAGPDAVHITLCELMGRELRDRYGGAIRQTLELSNTYTVGVDKGPKTAPPERFTLGHLSNLCVEKGLVTAINCLRLLRRADVDAMLRLAGPATDRKAAAIIEAGKAEFGDALVYDGLLCGAAKDEFYRAISVFLFPTEYRNEAQPLVVLETLAAGTPVVAYGRCCIPRDLGQVGGLIVPMAASFEQVALPRLLEWANDSAALERASVASRRRVEELQRQGEEHLQSLFAVLRSSGN
jgi:glycosyltransferase involved in cell wall biosynthesis